MLDVRVKVNFLTDTLSRSSSLLFSSKEIMAKKVSLCLLMVDAVIGIEVGSTPSLRIR